MPTELGGTDQVYPRVTFGALPDDVLPEIFDFYLALMNSRPARLRPYPEDAWHTLVHVCKRWRSIVFASPHRLELHLLCTNKRPVQNTLDIWPELPIVISDHREMSKPQDANNIVAALEEHTRVRKIHMDYIPNSFLRRIRTMKMENPFSALTSLNLLSTQINAPALPDSFLGGSAPRLQTLSLTGVPFPALPNLLLSVHDLVTLSLLEIPVSGYIAPEAMVDGLSALTRLKTLRLEFRSPRSRADEATRLVPRLTRLVLPALTSFDFKGNSEYLEDIVAQIDTPLLAQFYVTFFNQLVFDIPSLGHFISRTAMFKATHVARVMFWEGEVNVRLYQRNGNSSHETSSLAISCRPSDWQLWSVVQVCDSALSRLPTLERLGIHIARSWKDDVEIAQWLELLRPFTCMDLCLYGTSIQHVPLALEQLTGERATEALSALQNLFLEGPQPSDSVKKAIGKFVAARQLSDRLVSVHHRDTLQSTTWQQMHWEVGD
jgi:F-box-like